MLQHKFYAKNIPKISVLDYLLRLYNLCGMTRETLICSLIYLDRFVRRKHFVVTMHEIHRLLAISCVVSVKFHHDDFYDNEYYSRVAGISLEELNDLEAAFLWAVDYKVLITEAEFLKHRRRIQNFLESKCVDRFKPRGTSIFPKFVKTEEQTKGRDYASGVVRKRLAQRN